MNMLIYYQNGRMNIEDKELVHYGLDGVDPSKRNLSQHELLESGWDIIVNAICVWIMLDTSKWYWNVCKRYGVCVCCYGKTNEMEISI